MVFASGSHRKKIIIVRRFTKVGLEGGPLGRNDSGRVERTACRKYGWLLSLELLLLVIADIPLAYGQQGNTCTDGQISLGN